MSERSTSTVSFRSNLQPVRGSYREDQSFLRAVHDIFALELLQKAGYGLSSLQMQEYRNASLHCAYAYKDDYPFGTVFAEDGGQRVVCRCTNTACSRFHICRPDFDLEELQVVEDNVVFRSKIAEIDESLSGGKSIGNDSITGDIIAAVELFRPAKTAIVKHDQEQVIQEPVVQPTVPQVPITQIPVTQSLEVQKPLSQELSQEEKPAPSPAQAKAPVIRPDASFSSFVEAEQEDIIYLPITERTIINAGPGTGKTWTLIEKIKYMLSDLETDPANILVLCFSRAAVEVVRNRLEEAAGRDELPLNWHQIDVRTFDSFATYLLAWLQENIPSILPAGYSLEGQSYDARIHMAAHILSTQKDLLAEYQHIIVDEVQDLVGVRAKLVLALLRGLSDNCGFTLLGDSCQALYDYLAVNDGSVMSSEQFYKKLFHEYREANYYSLTHNYRQGDEFGELSIPYRKAILSEDETLRTKEAQKLDAKLPTSHLDLRRVTTVELRPFLKEGTLGILSRTNGQALQISSWLRAEGIQHTFQRPAQSQDLAVWIARILLNAETDVIDQSEFQELFINYYPVKAASSGRYWDALISTQRDQSKTHYEIEDLLRGIFQNARNPLLFEEPTELQTTITISNIHRAKGREFDSVLVLQDVLENMTDDEKNDLLEHKVCYVALTRPKKKVEKVTLKPQYIYISKDETRRCFKAGGFGSKRYLSHFEVGDGTDFNARSYARSKEIQEYIQTLKPDTRLKLQKCTEGTKSYVLYRIVPEEDERMVLGYTTPSFARSLEWAIQRVFSNPHSIAYKYYPNVFGDIYLDGLTTCISSSDTGISGAKCFGGMYIWYGLSISGFAQMEKDRY